MVFRNAESWKVGLYQSLLESSGIPTFLKNEFTDAALGSFPDESPELWVVKDEDSERATEVISAHQLG